MPIASQRRKCRYRVTNVGPAAGLLGLALLLGGSCPGPLQPGFIPYNNTTDPTNGGSAYIGSAACRSCHQSLADTIRLHGHEYMLTKVQGQPPAYPPEATRAGVPNPPVGRAWADISYVIGGFTKAARFLGLDGFILTNGFDGVDAQWNLSLPANGTAPSFAPADTGATQPTPYDYSCFQCHTTGPAPQDPAHPRFQDNRPGLVGTWHENGVHCEACHGPGSIHVASPAQRRQYVNSTASLCGQCHSNGGDPSSISAGSGFIEHHQQWSELRASGGHKDFACTYCHDPHVGSSYTSTRGIRNDCTACHAEQNMALHDGKVFTRGNYTEPLTCISCHMPFATRTASSAGEAIVGPLGRLGDTRTHIFRTSREVAGFSAFFSADGKSVRKDAEGRAAVTVDFVCLRCHNGNGAFHMTIAQAADKVQGVHRVFPPLPE